jgi:transposase
VWGLVQRFHVIFTAPDEESANRAVENLAEAYQAAGVNLGSAISSFCRRGPESLNFHADRCTNAASEGVNGKIEVLERMAYGFRSRANYVARVLLVCSGHPPASSSE